METRTCARCGETKPLSDFHSDVTQPLGKDYSCKRCANKASNDWKKRNPERTRKQVYAWRQANRERANEIARKSYQKNKDKRKRESSQWRRDNPERQHDYILATRLGLPLGTYARMLTEQGGVCAICGTDKPGGRGGKHFHMDHCHDTGAIRGLLCATCNIGIAHMKHDPVILRAAIKYLQK